MESADVQHVELGLMSPVKVGPFNLSHRVVLAPMTRCRAINNVPNEAHIEYYTQRATPGGLLITEAVSVSETGHGFPNSPGIYTEEQVAAWRRVVEAVHAKGAILFCQLWHVGRASHVIYQPGGNPPVSSTGKRISDRWKILMPDGSSQRYSTPRALKTSEVHSLVRRFGEAARNAAAAGFDGVEIHGGHGYLLDQFMKDSINDRTDHYGCGSLEKRCRFTLEVVEAVAEEVGAKRTALRISPVVDHLDAVDSEPVVLGRYLLSRLNALAEPLCYLHLTQPRYSARKVSCVKEMEAFDTCQAEMRRVFKGIMIATGGYTPESSDAAVRSGEADLVSFGRLFIANPDLPLRLRIGAPLNKYDRSTFYTSHPVKGYTDYPFIHHERQLRPPPAYSVFLRASL